MDCYTDLFGNPVPTAQARNEEPSPHEIQRLYATLVKQRIASPSNVAAGLVKAIFRDIESWCTSCRGLADWWWFEELGLEELARLIIGRRCYTCYFLDRQFARCAYCAKYLLPERERNTRGWTKQRYHIDHIDSRIASPYWEVEKFQALCPTCNCRKSDRDPVEFAQSLGLLC